HPVGNIGPRESVGGEKDRPLGSAATLRIDVPLRRIDDPEPEADEVRAVDHTDLRAGYGSRGRAREAAGQEDELRTPQLDHAITVPAPLQPDFPGPVPHLKGTHVQGELFPDVRDR